MGSTKYPSHSVFTKSNTLTRNHSHLLPVFWDQFCWWLKKTDIDTMIHQDYCLLWCFVIIDYLLDHLELSQQPTCTFNKMQRGSMGQLPCPISLPLCSACFQWRCRANAARSSLSSELGFIREGFRKTAKFSLI